jgi:polar amino acid transport system substrate-binding protein
MAWRRWAIWCASAGVVLLPALATACALRLPLINLTAARPGAPRTGLDLELADVIVRAAGCELIVSDGLSRQRRDLLFSLGQADLILAASDTPEREQIARFSLPYRMEVVRLFSLQRRRARYATVAGFADLVRMGEKLLVPAGGWYGPAYAAAEPALQANGQLATFKTFDLGLHMLEAGRAGLIMGDAVGMQKAAARSGVPIAPLEFIVLRAPVHLMLNRLTVSAQDVERINAAIGRLEANGTLRSIRRHYCDGCDL